MRLPYSGTTRKYYLTQSHLTGNKNKWFYFSPKLNGVLCLPCVLFAPDKVGKGESQTVGTLVLKPMTNFKHIYGKDKGIYTHHYLSKYHQLAVEEFEEVSNQNIRGDISANLKTQDSKQLDDNRYLFKAVLHELEYLGRTNSGIRGHRNETGRINVIEDETDIDYTQGNLRILLQKRCLRDKRLAEILRSSPKNATFLSPEMQNKIIDCIGFSILQQISDAIRQAGFFSVCADETADVSRSEQLTMSIRYVDTNLQAVESFVGFIQLHGQTGSAISQAILNHLEKLGIDKNDMIAQGYDGAAAMSGKTNGTQSQIRQHCPRAIYIHCFSHSLNLAISASTDIAEVKSTYSTISDISNFFKNSCQRQDKFKEYIDRLCPNSSHSRLKAFCPTRWVERHDTFFIFIELLLPLAHLFENLREYNLLNSLTNAPFIVTAYLLRELLGLTKGLSVLLQNSQLDLIKAVHEVQTVVQCLQNWRSCTKDSVFDYAYDQAEDMFKRLTEEEEIPVRRCVGRQKHRNNVEYTTARQYYKRAIWYPLLDCTLQQLNERFSEQSTTAMKIVSLLPPLCLSDSATSDALSAFNQYADLTDGIDACMSEFRHWQNRWRAEEREVRESINSISSTIQKCDFSIFPNLFRIFKIFMTIPVTTATAERSFSQLRLLKTHMRSVMLSDRLNGLALMAIHKDIKIDYNDVIQRFAMQYDTRLRLK